jgi:diguanylate cyclase (GGDEF)-like protein
VPWSRVDLEAAAEFSAAIPALRSARAREALSKLALRDSLTGLPNRALLHDRLEVVLAELQRRGTRVWVIFLDLDGFKEVNDALGHEAGDEVIVEVATRIRQAVRASDTVARLGGDEFVIVCADDATTENVDSLVGRLLDSIARPISARGELCTVTASIGLAEVEMSWEPQEALSAADAAMYRAKNLGRNRASR